MNISTFRQGFALLLAGTLLSASCVQASEPTGIKSSDYALDQDGTFAGSILNRSAQPVDGMKVHVLHQNRVIATAVSDEQGRFAVSGLRYGTHALQVGGSFEKVRFWSQDAAPPGAGSRVTIIVDERVVRGQDSGAAGWNAVVTAGLFGGAVAATLATTLDVNDSPASP